MSKEDLKCINEGLAKAVGFNWEKWTSVNRYPNSGWVCKGNWMEKLPDFTNSMDACIEWIYPVLHKPVEIGNIVGGWCCRIGRSGWFKAESMSGAFCLAAYKSLEEIK